MERTKITDGSIRQFNPSIVEFDGKMFTAIRNFESKSSILINGKAVKFLDRRCAIGQEDPRLFVWKGSLWVAFVGVCRSSIRQMYGRIEADPTTGGWICYEAYMPTFPGRIQSVEKNWSFYVGRDGRLYAVYMINPLVILWLDGNEARIIYWKENKNQYYGGRPLHGGCIVRSKVDPSLLYHWFHSYDENVPGHPGRVYNYSVYTMREESHSIPIVKWLDKPLLTALDKRLEPKPEGYLHSVVFPGGAVIERGMFSIAVGVHDQWCEIHTWSVAEINSLLAGNGVVGKRALGLCDDVGDLLDGPRQASCQCRYECNYKPSGKPFAIPSSVCQNCNSHSELRNVNANV